MASMVEPSSCLVEAIAVARRNAGPGQGVAASTIMVYDPAFAFGPGDNGSTSTGWVRSSTPDRRRRLFGARTGVTAVIDWTVTPLTGALGARVEGPHLSTLDAPGWDQLDKLLVEHKVLALPGQRLTPTEQVELASRFGQPYRHRFLPTVSGHPAVVETTEESEAGGSGGEYWVSDLSYRSPPGSISVLSVKELTRYGGDTLFSDTVMAYRTLSAEMRAFVDRLRAVHVFPGVVETSQSSAVHPLVRRHPLTGERALYLNPAHVTRIEGLTSAESRAMIELLGSHAADPELTCRVTWTPDQVMIWDNRVTMHTSALGPGERRRYHLVTAIERNAR